jgi:aminopeptidase 2
MLASHIVAETFLKGVSVYLKGHLYGNTTSKDLLTEASGIDVGDILKEWMTKVT